MKRITIILALLTFLIGLIGVDAATTEQRFMGRLFRAVQSDNSLWYVNPKDGTRHEIKSESDSLETIQKNLYIPTKSEFKLLQKKLSSKAVGKFVLNNENKIIYYADPAKKKLQMVGRAEKSFYPLGKLATGISNKDLEKIPTSQPLSLETYGTPSSSTFSMSAPCPSSKQSIDDSSSSPLTQTDFSNMSELERAQDLALRATSALDLIGEQQKRAYQRQKESREFSEVMLDAYYSPITIFTVEDLWNMRCGNITPEIMKHAKAAKPSDLRSRSEREARAVQRERQRTLDAIQEQQEEQIKDLKSIKSILKIGWIVKLDALKWI